MADAWLSDPRIHSPKVMRRLLLAVCMAATLLLSCSKTEQKVDFAAANAAKQYYEWLLTGNHDAFVRGLDFPDSIPDSYREQLVANAKMFVGTQKEEHGGLREVRIVNCVNDSLSSTASAFLLLSFGDNSTEEIVVPMIRKNEKWYMK